MLYYFFFWNASAQTGKFDKKRLIERENLIQFQIMGRFDFSSSPAYHAYVCPDSFFSFQRIKENCMHIFAKKKHFFVRFFFVAQCKLARSLSFARVSHVIRWQPNFGSNIFITYFKSIYRELNGIIVEKSMTMVSAYCATMTSLVLERVREEEWKISLLWYNLFKGQLTFNFLSLCCRCFIDYIQFSWNASHITRSLQFDKSEQ